jgi:transposase
MAGEVLLAQIIVDKYIDHLPLHRQMQRLKRTGVKLAYSTVTDWVSGTCKLFLQSNSFKGKNCRRKIQAAAWVYCL